jgi:hypothetical protein
LPFARESGKIGKLRAKLAVGYWMQAKFYLLQQILFSFCALQGLQGEVRTTTCCIKKFGGVHPGGAGLGHKAACSQPLHSKRF